MSSHSQASAIGFPETSVINYQFSLRNNPEERSSQLLRAGSLKRCSVQAFFTRTDRHSSVCLVKISFDSHTLLAVAREHLPALSI